MANSIKILELLKWNTDKEHPITQENLRKLPGADVCMGYKTTFKRHLFEIAETLNSDIDDENNWRILFPGYKSKDLFEKSHNSQRHYIGPIYYNHEIEKHELDFIILQIQSSKVFTEDEKRNLANRLIKLLGSRYYSSPSAQNIYEIIDTPTTNTDILNQNLNFLRTAITKQKMISFYTTVLNEKNELKYQAGDFMVSPYMIIFYKSNYWLIGNKRLGRCDLTDYHFTKYADTYDIFRIDKMKGLTFAKEVAEKKAKYFLDIGHNLKTLKNILFFTEGEKINYHTLTNIDNYKIEFEIIWENFPSNTRYDYTFIKDAFGSNYTVANDKKKTLITTFATEDFFVDWALSNIDKIHICDTFPSSADIKKKIKDRLQKGLENL